MLRTLIPIGLAILFLGWVAYRLLIKKDFKKQLPTFYLGFAFIATWVIIYWFLLKK